MRILILDQNEFDTPSSEESLFIVTEHSKWSKNIDSFYRKTCKIQEIQHLLPSEVKDLPAETLVEKLHDSSYLSQYLNECQGILLDGNVKCITLIEEWDTYDYLIFNKHYFIRYCWSTTA